MLIKIKMAVLVLLAFVITTSIGNAQSLDDQINQFYSTYIKQGQVAYAQIRQTNSGLDQLIQEIKAVNWSELSSSHQQAFLINAYNLYVIKAVVDRYPVQSPKSINSFFTQKKYKLAGQNYSLDQIEKTLLFGIKRDARFHLVLICGAKSCPPFYPKAFQGGTLEAQLEEASTAAINSDWVKMEGNQYLLSEIFGWYAHDFGNTIDFINKYLAVNKINNTDGSNRIRLLDYDWGLNEYLENNQIQQPFLTASQLMPVGTWELKLFQSVYTQVERNGFERDNSRSTFFSSFNQFLVGLKPGLNIGVDVVWKRNNINALASDSWLNVLSEPLGESLTIVPCSDENGNFTENSPCFNPGEKVDDVLRNSNGDTLTHRVQQGVAHIGPKAKFRLSKKIPRLTFQQTLYIPIQKDVDGQWISFSQFFYDQRIGAKGALFAEVSFWTPVSPDISVIPFIKTFWSYFPNRVFSLYGMLAFPGEYGGGIKINLTRRIELELLTTNFIAIEKFFGDRRASTFNLGLRIHP